MAAPTKTDEQCSYSLFSRKCSARAGYDVNTCVPYGGRCYTTYKPAQCSAHADCSTSWTGECTNRRGASSLYCRHTGAYGACECVAPMLTVRMWPSSMFPEQCTPGLIPASAKLSFALSGGGCRAHSAATGMFRYLRSKGADKAARYVSSVSGSSWFYGMYSFAQAKGYSAASLLGASSRAPAAITLANLDTDNFQTGSAFVGVPCTNADLVAYMLAALAPANNVPVSEAWEWSMAQIFLKPYGLHNNVPVAASAAHAAAIEKTNPQLGPALIPEPGLPFWLSNVVFQHPSIPDAEKFPAGVMTPLYSGLAGQRSAGGVSVGGVSVETFALGTNAPSSTTVSAIRVASCAGVTATIPAVRNNVCSLKSLIGVSSTAYIGWILDKLPSTSGLIPAYNMWPLASAAPPSTSMFAGDGAMVDNTGILPLLSRGESKIVALLAESTLLTSDTCTTNINHLFGVLDKCTIDYTNAGVRTSQVFRAEDFPAFKAQLLSTRAAGGPCFARADLAVQPNALHNVRGGYTVSLLLVVVQPCAQFNAVLPAAVRAEFAAGKSLAKFPLFKTMEQNPPNIMQYTKRQVNLLASQVEWMFRHSSIQTALQSM